MDERCYKTKRDAAMKTLARDLRMEDPDVVLISSSSDVRDTIGDVKASYQVNICKKSDKGAKAAYQIDESGNAKKVYVLGGGSESSEPEDEKGAQPTKEQRRKAAVCRHMSEMIGAHIENGKALPTNPMRSHQNGELLEFVMVTGTHWPNNSPDADEWSDLKNKSHIELADIVWERIASVLKQRVKYYKVSECEAFYDEAVAIAGRVFGMSQDDLDEAAE